MRPGRKLPSKRSQRRAAFTILDVMLALVIGFVVVLTARELLVQLTLSDTRLEDAARKEARARNSQRYLVDLMSRLEVGTDSTRTFTGEPTQAAFTSWCAVPRGWLERCDATLVVDTTAHPNVMFVATTRGDTVLLKRGAEQTSFRYFTDPEDPDTWVFHWGHGISAPVGIAIITPFDTTLIRIGTRG